MVQPNDAPDLPTRVDTTIKAALALLPYVGGALAILYEDVLTRRRAKLEVFGKAAFERHPDGWEGFLQHLQGDARLAELFVRAGESAQTSTVRQKAAALGRLLADAATAGTEDEVDNMELLTLALIDLEWPHIRALSRLAEYPSDAEIEREPGADGKKIGEDVRRKARFALQRALSEPALSALVRHGLVGQQSGYGLYVSGVTQHGRDLLGYITMSDDTPPPE